jgi:DNA helicase-2/ATP-dependent DNA helicase PcrA
MAPDPIATGRSVVVGPADTTPAGWDGCERVVVDAVDADLADHLSAAWRERRPVIVELHPGLGLDEPSTPPAEAVTGRQPWELDVTLDLTADRLHHAMWANTGWWAGIAEGLGARPGGALDVVLPDGTEAVCDGGPLDAGLGERLGGVPVVHRIALEHGSLRPLGANHSGAELAPDQLAAVTHPGGGARIIAPAGSGKTRVLTERARLLLGSWGLPPASMAVVAFNRRAAEELRSRTTDLSGLRIRTLNALGLRLLPDGIRTIEEPRARDHLGQLVDLPRRAETDPAAPWLEALGRVRLGLTPPAVVEAELDDVSGLDDVARRYRDRLRSHGEADFDDQVVGAIERLLADPPFRHRAQRFARILLVDEFQDLTPAHLLLIRLLTGPAGSVFGVGDDDQTIYGYAGATPEWLVRFGEVFPGSGAHPLEVNYRCPPAVVSAAANLLTRNAVRVPKTIRPAPGATDGPGAFAVVGGTDDPATRTAAHVRSLVADGVDPTGVAVLARINASLAPVQVLLRHHGVPVRGGVDARFLTRGGVRAALAWLAVAAAPEQVLPAAALREAARRPKRGLGDRVLGWIAEQRSVEGLRRLAGRITNERDAAKVADLAADVARVRQAAASGSTDAVLDVVRHEVGSGGLDASASALDGWSHGAVSSHTDDLDALVALAHLEPEPARFGDWLADALAQPDDDGGVTLASIHAVKGQEWPHVVVHHVTAGLLPHRLVDDVEEERRVLHVGLTRGRATVTVVPGAPPSPFLGELAAPGEPPPRPPAVPRRAATSGSRPDPTADLLDPAAEAAFERLRAWRTETARVAGKPAYTVFADSTLRELARRLPTDETGLRAVSGIGPAKLDAYGDALLALMEELRAAAAPSPD